MTPVRMLAALAVALLVASQAAAADRKEIMRSRYLRYQFCMEKVYGTPVYPKVGLDSVLNKWGISEPTRRSIERAPEGVRKVDQRCRASNELEAEPRP